MAPMRLAGGAFKRAERPALPASGLICASTGLAALRFRLPELGQLAARSEIYAARVIMAKSGQGTISTVRDSV